jgi:hypothetical protein
VYINEQNTTNQRCSVNSYSGLLRKAEKLSKLNPPLGYLETPRLENLCFDLDLDLKHALDFDLLGVTLPRSDLHLKLAASHPPDLDLDHYSMPIRATHQHSA